MHKEFRIIQIRHIGVVVRNMELSIDFYNSLLGFEVGRDVIEEGEFIDNFLGIEGVKVRTVKLFSDNNAKLELLRFESHPEYQSSNFITQVGCSHFAVTVENLDSLYEKAVANEIEFVSGPRISPDGRVKAAFCKDPDGTWIEMVEEIK